MAPLLAISPDEGFNIKFLFSSADAFTAIPGTVKLPLVITNALHKVIQNGLFNTCFHFTIKLLLLFCLPGLFTILL